MLSHNKIRIGILSQYYNSTNYGGNLQAYALCQILNEIYPGIHAEQLQYSSYKDGSRIRRTARVLLDTLSEVKARICHRKAYQFIDRRRAAVLQFNKIKIPHSDRVYNRITIPESNQKYDGFIVGSDRVWFLGALGYTYLLNFADPGKGKLSYAASIAGKKLSEQDKEMFRKAFQSYDAVSIREQDKKELLQPLTEKNVEWVLDPTLLLTADDWNKIAADRIVLEPYMFCYYLGDNRDERELARQYAQNKGLKLVTVPYVSDQYSLCDEAFGDIQLSDVSPSQFISLIKYANIVFTDSFHGTAFCTIYRKDFFAFERAKNSEMSARLHSLFNLIHAQERLCDTQDRATYQYLCQCGSIPYRETEEMMESAREQSLEFLDHTLSMRYGNIIYEK